MIPCRNYAAGHCPFGNKCRFDHGGSDPISPKPNPAAPAFAPKRAEPAFPSVEAAANRYSDHLICPAHVQPHHTASSILFALGKSSEVLTLAESEKLVFALSQSNCVNSLWTHEERQLVLNEVGKKDANEKQGNLLVHLGRILSFPYVDPWGDEGLAFPTYMAIIGYFTSESVLQTAATNRTNALYDVVSDHLEKVLNTLTTSIGAYVQSRSFSNVNRPHAAQSITTIVSGVQIFKPVASLLIELANRYTTAYLPELEVFVPWFIKQFVVWSYGVEVGAFIDSLSQVDNKVAVLDVVRKEITLLEEIFSPVLEGYTPVFIDEQFDPELDEYDGPGEFAEDGPRHSNDHSAIRDINILPAVDEILAEDTFMPFNVAGALHHDREDSMAKILDIQFRLLRTDCLDGFQKGLRAVVRDIAAVNKKTQLSNCIRNRGGLYTEQSIRLPVLTNVTFTGFSLDSRAGLVVQIEADVPPGHGRTRSRDARAAYWQTSNRMTQGGLVALVTAETSGRSDISVATLTTPVKNFTHPNCRDGKRARVGFGLCFAKPQDALRAAKVIQRGEPNDFANRFLFESPVMYESIQPFLKTLKNLDPARFPLRKYLVHTGLESVEIGPPAYARNFEWDLSVLLRDSNVRCSLNPSKPASIASAREVMKACGKLDPSQSDAVIDSLTREIALIQGPPGTGKTFTAVELLRVLFANNAGPVLLLAFTNHALDHILRSIHDGEVTRDIVRLGSRSKDEVISEYSLESVSRARGKDKLTGVANHCFKVVKEMEQEMESVLDSMVNKASILHDYIQKHHSALLATVNKPPQDVQTWFDGLVAEAATGKKTPTLWSVWRTGGDLKALEKSDLTESETVEHEVVSSVESELTDDREEHSDIESEHSYHSEDTEDQFSDQHSYAESDYRFDEEEYSDFGSYSDEEEPAEIQKVFERDVDTLLASLADAWGFSDSERGRLVDYLEDESKRTVDKEATATFREAVKKYNRARRELEQARNNASAAVLKNVQLVGATTNGAAKFSGVMQAFAPKVLVIEEAGQVMEAHVLSTLFPSVEHVIAIGDPLQLRPNINTYELSMDHPRGKECYRFDMSLMERLSSSGLPMSQLQIQRRMTPPISSLIRNTLYPNLVDHELVKEYPPVSGMGSNMFFFDHEHREKVNGSSRTNPFEAAMVCDLAMHLLRQGCYSKEGDIVILCAYLGQLAEIRKRLKGKVMVTIDERDQAQMGEMSDEDEGPREVEVSVGRQVILRTVDNFQGEEAAIVILSLVRNSAEGSIGFLGSSNRTNVAISRAKHGMYIFGNAKQLSSANDMWKTIIDELSEQELVGPGLPIACDRHGTVTYVFEPGELALVAPEGGCKHSCDETLKCGHWCNRQCHADDPNHEHVRCKEQCKRVRPCGHACKRACNEDCGKCCVPYDEVDLDCGHTVQLLCWHRDDPTTVTCKTRVTKSLPCKHTVTMSCSKADTAVCKRSGCKKRDIKQRPSKQSEPVDEQLGPKRGESGEDQPTSQRGEPAEEQREQREQREQPEEPEQREQREQGEQGEQREPSLPSDEQPSTAKRSGREQRSIPKSRDAAGERSGPKRSDREQRSRSKPGEAAEARQSRRPRKPEMRTRDGPSRRQNRTTPSD